VVEQGHRVKLWRFLLCWFVPGILFLSLGMALKSHHYGLPILPALTIPTALGIDYYVRRQATRRPGLVWPWFLGGCIIAAFVVWRLPQIPHPLKSPLIALIALLAAGGLASLHFEKKRRPNAVLAAYFLTAWAVSVGVQSWAMPVQDDFAYQAHFARDVVNAQVPPGATVYVLGHREEEQEAEYTYYLRFPMQRLTTAADFAAVVKGAGSPVYAVAPEGFLSELGGVGEVRTLAKCEGLRGKETEGDRLCLIRVVGR
jgi:4-amino-4-deoxy-L-arabinose transferase-like glycosyltransferase